MLASTLFKGISAALVAGTLSVASASAMPAGQLNSAAKEVSGTEQVRLICDGWGRCWRQPNYYYGGPAFYYGGGPRFYGHRHWGHRHHHHHHWRGSGRRWR